jgi:hypothetical protein
LVLGPALVEWGWGSPPAQKKYYFGMLAEIWTALPSFRNQEKKDWVVAER